MSNYYALVAGLPNIAFEDSKLTYSIEAFRLEIEELLTKKDRKLIDLFFLKFDNSNLLLFLKDSDSSLDSRGNFSQQEMSEIVQAIKEESYNIKNIPPYFIPFVKGYVEEKLPVGVSSEDWLSSLYYEYAMKCKNTFVARWFELNLNINNILTAFTCNRYDMDKESYVVGNNEVAEIMRTSNARDLGLTNYISYLPDLQRISEETDLMEREKKIDLLKWNWIEENTFFNYFSIERVVAYLLQLEMIERWVSLDWELGNKMFREIIQGLKQESLSSLEEFKRTNNK